MLLHQKDCLPDMTCNSFPLERKKVFKKAIFGDIGVIFTFLALGLFIPLTGWLLLWTDDQLQNQQYLIMFVRLPTVVVLLLFTLAMFWRIIYEIFYFRNYFYDIREDYVAIRKGWIARREINLYFNRVQNIFVDQDFFDRIFKLYDVHIATADVQSIPIAHIDGVNETNAKNLKVILLAKVKQHSSQRGQTGL